MGEDITLTHASLWSPWRLHGLRGASTEWARSGHGVYTESTRSPHGVHTECTRSAHGVGKEWAWSGHGLHGVYMECTGSGHGVHREWAWSLQGLSLKFQDGARVESTTHSVESPGALRGVRGVHKD